MDIKNIVNEYKYKTELHVHTSPVSACAHVEVEDIMRAYASKGADSVVITNHINLRTTEKGSEFYLSDYYRACEVGETLGLNVILGVEIVFVENRNDYLVYGVEPHEIEKMIPYVKKGIEAFYKDFKNERNVILHAHPFRDHMSPTPLDFVDGIETYNLHMRHNSRIGAACAFAREHDLLVSGGSDFHDAGDEATIFARSKTKMRNSFDVAELIKSKDLLFDIGGSIVFPYGDR
jgi:predicted metal-dependent phosphoesterase TrpH